MKAARWAFTHKGKTLAITAAFSVAACTPLFMGKVPGAFLPPDDLSQSQINLELPPGSTYEETRAVAAQA
ncbi:efflux RND transporter permease subunit, partial [Klebsiella aerogenes]|uniref:efflux RND transporter permease subunit n=1 Tax=Klebsiella aerogenes TaxID=548 RepID=UPI001954A66F